MATSAERRPAPGLPVRVFLVEDSSLFRGRVVEQLSVSERIEIVGYADTEKTALDALGSVAWDVLILDLQLKQGNGMGVLKGLQARGRPVRAKIIVLTDHDFYLYRRKTAECGADYFFNKSREFHLVAAVLDEMVRERETSLS